jgi:selenide,water dikinase
MDEKIGLANAIRLTQYSHGAGCGCKIAPAVLDEILGSAGESQRFFSTLLVGNAEKDDAAVMDLGDGTAIISTTDFFMPIVDDPYVFGKIAATNAISDVYAMGGTPMMAIAILGWPVNVLSPEIAGEVVRGAKATCEEAGIPLAGGHSIDAPEPIFGLAVTGRVDVKFIKKNGGAVPGDVLFLTKPLGIGILTTAQKKEKLLPEHADLAPDLMMRLNTIGTWLGQNNHVRAMTDVTGFGLAGHLLEMCQASDCHAEIQFDQLPLIDPSIEDYIQAGCVPGGTDRNYASYGHEIHLAKTAYKSIVCDPQTSGGLLIAVARESVDTISQQLLQDGWYATPIGRMTTATNERTITVL